MIYVNSYDAVKVVTPTMRSDHKAVIAYAGAPPCQLNRTRERRVFRRRSPSQHAVVLQHAPAVTFDFHDGRADCRARLATAVRRRRRHRGRPENVALRRADTSTPAPPSNWKPIKCREDRRDVVMTTSAGDVHRLRTDCRRQRWTSATPARSELQ